ncbi:MAG: DNA (cytosine-5-)-methyltransferase [Planctomycetia bacterium]|nr:DNA (cytosine-5-)-methyltransferase [Planctomycetia bacterium]
MTINCIATAREQRCVDLETLASLLKIDAAELTAIEEGRVEPTVTLALQIATQLQTTVERLFTLEPTPEATQERAPVADGAEAPEPRAKSGDRALRRKRRDAKSRPEPIAPLVEPFPVPECDEAIPKAQERQTSLPLGVDLHEPGAMSTRIRVGSKTAQTHGLALSPADLVDPTDPEPVRFFDLFCGIGGFHYAVQRTFEKMGRRAICCASCDIDPYARESYQKNFGQTPLGDVCVMPSDEIPEFDVLCAGFPCQTFSIIGLRKGFTDQTKGTLFFQIARILRDKRPRAFVLENVRQLTSHDNGRTFAIILDVLQQKLGYYVDWRVLNALDCGLPQKRERVVIVGSTAPFDMQWPLPDRERASLAQILEPEESIPRRYFASDAIVARRHAAHVSKFQPAIWHENKAGNISSYPYSCALRAGASYNYLLVDGKRRLTPREMLRLQGFPDSFEIVVSDSQLRKQAGNAAPVHLLARAMERFFPLVFRSHAVESAS